ncbi:MAG: hypothetical protein JWO87_3937 [Phycisphaerales bacterium]|nr:hypothetical protein [Phycisphaerales bacterium]
MHRMMSAAAVMLAVLCGRALAEDRPLNHAPEGFTNLFEGKTLEGWRGRKGDYSPYDEAKLSKEQLAAEQTKWNADRDKHWTVDTAKGEIVSDGHGVFLATGKDYGDFEFYVDWLMVSHNGDSGVYLRGYPQVQVWDPDNAREVGNGANKGSGALWNNNADNPGKWPLVRADNPVGQWNTFRIKMIGSRVWVWLNGKPTVDGQILDNYFDRSRPVLPTGPIELQTHGSEIRFRNIYAREIPTTEANATLDKLASTGFESIFNGKDLTGWAGPVDEYQVHEGAIMCKPGKGGTLHTEQEYGDFEARLEFKLPPGGNNGLAIRYPGHGDTAYEGMCELQILDDTATKYKALDPRQYCCSVYGVVPAKTGYLRPLGEWNYEHVVIKGHTIKVELNGNIVTEADVSTVHEFMANSKHPGLMRTKGSFGFAGHNDPVEFRNIRIKKLD